MWFLSIVMLLATVLLVLMVARGQQVPLAGIPYEEGDGALEGSWTEEGETPTAAQLAAAYREADLEAAAAAVERLAQPCVRLAAAVMDEGARTQMGGVPDLPDIARWPKWGDVSLSFLVQLDLAEVAAVLPESPLPKTGLLQFYYDPGQRTRGLNPADRESWRVLYFAEPFEAIQIHDWPEDLPDHGCLPVTPLVLERIDSVPDNLAEICAGEVSPGEIVAVEAILHQFLDSYDGPCHQVLGYSYAIDEGMPLQCQLASTGTPCEGTEHADLPERVPGAEDWRLLLQVDSDEEAGMMWGEFGTLFFWIRAQDLAAARFDRVWMIFQSA